MANKRISFNQKHKTTDNSGDDLFRKTITDNVDNSMEELEEILDNQNRRRQTYYLDEDIIEAIREMSHQKRKDKSELVRELLRSSALNQYMQ